MNFVNIKQRWVIGDEYLLINHLLSNDFSSFEVIEIVLDYYGSSLLYCDVSFCNDIVRCRVSTQLDYFFQFQNIAGYQFEHLKMAILFGGVNPLDRTVKC